MLKNLVSKALSEVCSNPEEGLLVSYQAMTRDPLSGTLYIAIGNPAKLHTKITDSHNVNDGTVCYARLDVDANGNPLALEIKPLKGTYDNFSYRN